MRRDVHGAVHIDDHRGLLVRRVPDALGGVLPLAAETGTERVMAASTAAAMSAILRIG
jgi:hypothetical protein